jgi:RNA recognition motif. (a.k.a. RRM, RBD, or RNP domain)
MARPRFAFVEYESRRDADDAYHEMHNKRIGRDDLLKIEVSLPIRYNARLTSVLTIYPVGSYSSIRVMAFRLRS